MRFKHAIGVAMAIALGLTAVPAHADYVVRSGDTTPVQMTFKSFISSLIHWPAHVMGGLFGGVPTAVNMTSAGALDVTPMALPPLASTSTNQTATQANPGADASKAHAIQGVTGGKPVPVTGTFFQTTQPISAASLPLGTGGATATNQTAVQGIFGSQTANKSVLYDASGNPVVWADFTPTGDATLAVTTSSAFVALPNTDSTIIIVNTGTADAEFKLGTGSPTAATTDHFLGAGRAMSASIGANTALAAITPSGSTTLKIMQGTGSPFFSGGGGGSGGALVAGVATVGDVGTASFGGAGSVCSTLTLPGAGGTYATGQAVLNNATAGSVTNQTCQVARYATGPFTLTGVRVLTSNTTITNGSFRIHFYVTAPTYSSGNGAALSTAHAGHFCSMDVTLGAVSGGQVFSDGADGFGVPIVSGGCTRQLVTGQVIYPVIEARGAYAWTAAQTFVIFPQGFN